MSVSSFATAGENTPLIENEERSLIFFPYLTPKEEEDENVDYITHPELNDRSQRTES